MTTPTIPTCPLYLTPGDLSAWRDHALPVADERRITAHTGACPACQRTIVAHEALAFALQADEPPTPDPRNWSLVQARIASSDHTAAPRRHTPRRALWSGLTAAAAVVLITALFFNLFEHLAASRNGARLVATPTVSPTPIVTPQAIPIDVPPTVPIAGTPLQWQTRERPADLVPMSSAGDTIHSNAIAFSPTDARTAYACSITRGTSATLDVWATHDGALSWTHMNTTTIDLTWHGCIFNVDAGDPKRVEITLTTAYGAQTSTSRSILSDDGGKTWRQIADHLMFSDLVTRGKTSIAIKAQWPPLMPPPAGPPPPNAQQATKYLELVASDDDWRTWHPIGSALVEQGLVVEDVWQRPGDGALLVNAGWETGFANASDLQQLWQSIDLGAHWTRIPTPTNLRADNGYGVAQPLANAPWHACGAMEIGKEVGKPTTLLACTQDSGQTWETRPMPLFSQICVYACSVGEQLGLPSQTSDGTLLGISSGHVTASGAQQNSSGYADYFMLPSHATQWQDMGAIGGIPFVIGGPTTTLVILPNPINMTDTGRWGLPSGAFITHGEPGVANTIEVAMLP